MSIVNGNPNGVFSLILNFILLNLLRSVLSESSVPALMWDMQNNRMNMASGSLQLVSHDIFQNNYVNNFESPNILLFIQDKLSIEDFSNHADVVKKFPGFLGCQRSVYIPSLEINENPIESSFNETQYKKQKVTAESFKYDLGLVKDKKNLVIVELPSTEKDIALKESLAIMENVQKTLAGRAFTVIFTGRQPSVELESLEHRRIARSLKQAPSTGNSSFHHDKCVTIYLMNPIFVQASDGTSFQLPGSKSKHNPADCGDTKSIQSMTIIYIDVPQHPKVKLGFEFEKRPRGWALKGIQLQTNNAANNLGIDAYLYPTSKMETVPFNKSYSCGDTWVLKSNSSIPGSTSYTLTIKGIQVEAFTNGRPTFSTAFNCVGFFTIPILTGILTGVLLTLILIIGMYMLSEIKTMDRFDDPKGKHIMAHTGTNE